MKKIIWISLACVIFVITIIFLTPSNIFNLSDKTVTITQYQSSENKVTILIPKGWVNKPYFPGGSGNEIVLFGSLKDELVANMDNKKNDTDDVFSQKARAINGETFKQTENGLTFVDKFVDKSSNFDKVLLENKKINNGEYRCLQQKQDDHFYISCFLKLKDSSGALYHLNTFTKSYNSDLTSFYKVIESTKVLK